MCCTFVDVSDKLHKMHGTYVKIVFMILIWLRVSALFVSHRHVFYKRWYRKDTLMRPAVTYGCETWTFTSRNEKQLRIFKRKMLRKIFGPVQDENEIWRIRKNHELDELMGNADTVRFIKAEEWPG